MQVLYAKDTLNDMLKVKQSGTETISLFADTLGAVSYTHLDVYKRQPQLIAASAKLKIGLKKMKWSPPMNGISTLHFDTITQIMSNNTTRNNRLKRV